MVLGAIGCGALWSGLITWLRTRAPRRPAQPGGTVPATVLAAMRTLAYAEDPAVLNTTVLELADRGVLVIEPADSTHPALVYPGSVPNADTLPTYQASVVARLLHRRSDSGRPVPLSALQPGEDPTARAWHNQFMREVRAEAAELGLLRPALPVLLYAPLFIVGVACSGVFAAAAAHYWHPHTAIPIAVFGNAAIITFATLYWATRMRLTATGRRVLASAREPAPTTAAELLPRPQPALPAAAPAPQAGARVLASQLQPLPNHLVWSDYGGAWHPLNVGSRETYTLGGGFGAIMPLLLFAGICLGGALTTTAHQSAHVQVVSLAAFAGLPVLVLLGAMTALLVRRRLPKRAVLTGQVARLWAAKRNDETGGEYYYCTLDVGRAPESVRLKVGKAVFQRLQVGQLLEVTVNPRRKRIKDIRPASGQFG
ncbi:MAG TPA: hypothetical protein VH372_04420 [Actinospica sp.]|nr:hypothetical protein [Actinospica sp.]